MQYLVEQLTRKKIRRQPVTYSALSAQDRTRPAAVPNIMSRNDILFSLPFDLARNLLSNWLSMKDFGPLDSAYCSKIFRSTFLHYTEIMSPGMFEVEDSMYLWLDWVVSNKVQLYYRLEHSCLATQPSEAFLVNVLGRVSLLLYSKEDKLMSIACWALLYINTTPLFGTYAQPRYYRAIRDLLTHPQRSLQALAVRNVANMSAEGEAESAPIINYSMLPILKTLLYDPYMRVRKSTCWIIANILAESVPRIQHVFDCGIMPRLIELIQTDEPLVRKEVTWALSNCTKTATVEQLQVLLNLGLVQQLCNVFCTPQEPGIDLVAFSGIENVLAQHVPGVAQQVLECGAVVKIEELKRHQNKGISDRAQAVMVTFYPQFLAKEKATEAV